ncbi:MAG TPA: NAD(P)-dependent alcohol dehydrogenase [Acidimicrobiia bacterium]|nr:NAD(P)-dependent alcohol dehydrogenase [Acidimicrobiia bacterium]
MEDPKSTAATPETKTMRALVQKAYGENAREVFEMADVPTPDIDSDEVLIRVAASSINALDWHYMTGTPYFLRLESGLSTPKRRIPGADVAGTVVKVGSEVTGFKPGDEVFGEIGGGGFAEYAAGKARHLAHRPASLSLEEAATLGVAALTALQGLRDWAGMKPGDRILINGASGGVGTFAVQIARALGASHVTAVCSTSNAETARSLGTDRVIDYTQEDFTEINDKFDVFFDNAGSKSLGRSRRLLTDQGILVMVTGKKGNWFRPMDRGLAGVIRSKFWSQRFITKVAKASGEDGTVLAQLVDEGKLRPVIHRRFTLEEAIDALAHQATGHARGKSIVEVS